ncbi:MAG: TM2 domain-containing protein [Plectolyngbya sp. WJT66-NPBG17]|jgi:TM2 domain-containing membrane protein YozV|nr:TM2 domain-containing protein [Plectolyngbya sp. WJT66-NPBG17]MBW4526098.1 TM2 domain-containing protein [Phormidium tanganyikae FI6-MK23]
MTSGTSDDQSKKVAAGICAILLGGLGVHKFILGYTTEGIIMLIAFFPSCGLTSILGLVEGIIYLTKSDEEFATTYVRNKKGWL